MAKAASALPRPLHSDQFVLAELVERFFRDLTQNRLRRDVFRDVEELIMAVETYMDKHNQDPKPFIWTAKATDILEKVKRARATRDNRPSV